MGGGRQQSSGEDAMRSVSAEGERERAGVEDGPSVSRIGPTASWL
jgi:hypothetical protein